MSNKFKPVGYSASLALSNAEYRRIATDNDLALTKILKVKTYDQTTETDGFISLQGDVDDGKVLRIPLKRQHTSEISSYDDVIFLDTSGVLSAKINGKVSAIAVSLDSVQIPNVSSLPNPPTLSPGYTPLVMYGGNLQWFNQSENKWKIITST